MENLDFLNEQKNIEIISLKDMGETYLLNNTLYVPKGQLSKECEAIQKWINNGGIVQEQYGLEEAKEQKLLQINSAYEQATGELTKGVPNTEKQTWDKQENEARAYQKDNASPTPFLTNLASTRGIPLNLLVSKVIQKANAYTGAVGTLTGKRQRLEDLLEQASSSEEINAINWT